MKFRAEVFFPEEEEIIVPEAKELGVVVSREGETVLTAKPGTDTVMTALGEAGLESPCVLEQGVTYLPAADLCYWLNVYFVK